MVRLLIIIGTLIFLQAAGYGVFLCNRKYIWLIGFAFIEVVLKFYLLWWVSQLFV